MFTTEQILSLPKTELHCHLDGSIRIATFLDLAEEKNVHIPKKDGEDIEEILICGRMTGSLESYLNAFTITLSVLQDKDSLERVAYEIAEDAAQENVWYLEIRFSPVLHTQNGLTNKEIIDSVLCGLEKAEKDFGITTRLIICAMRTHSPDVAFDLANLVVDYKGSRVVAFDLAGAEANNPAKGFLKAFHHIINNNCNCTIHAGEAWPASSIAQAIHYCGALRVGHGTSLIEDGDLMRYVRDRRIPLEVCLTSNLQTCGVSDLKEHPAAEYLKNDIVVTINTDNRLMSATTVSKELEIGQQQLGWGKTEILQVVRNGFEASFLGYDEKKKLLERVDEKLQQLVN